MAMHNRIVVILIINGAVLGSSPSRSNHANDLILLFPNLIHFKTLPIVVFSYF